MKSIKFAIITHVSHIQKEEKYFGYAPYVQEMNIWLKHIDEVIIVAPLKADLVKLIDKNYIANKIDFRTVSDFSFVSFKTNVSSLLKLPIILWRIFMAIKQADHIHLRCPGNIGLLGCVVQILFPKKMKTAKYAGNWDTQSKQPWTYKLQRFILKNTFLTQNMTVLIYGDWNDNTKNIKPFFTATYSESEKENIPKTNLNTVVEFIFVGSLVKGKNPIYAVKVVEELVEKGINAVLSFYGEGIERTSLEKYIEEQQLQNFIFLHGNQNKETVKKAYQKSHFVILPSKSEGWPKAIAEGMFWGCVPIATKVSCVPFMLDYGKRGILLTMNLNEDLAQIENLLSDENSFLTKSASALKWSQDYTTDVFEAEIKKLLTK